MNVVLALGCLLIVLLSAAGILLRDVIRSKDLQRRGRSLGFSFEAISEAVTGPELKATSCVQQGCSSVAFNVLTGVANGLKVRVFDVRDERLESPVLTTVAAFRSSVIEPSAFELGMKSLVRRIADAPELRRACPGQENLLGGFSIHRLTNDTSMDDLLASPRLERLRLTMNRYRLSCSPEWFFVYRPGIKIRAKDFSRFLEETARIAQALITCASEVQKIASGAASGGRSISRGAGA